MPHLKKIDISSSNTTMHYLNHLWNIVKKKKTNNKEEIIKGIKEIYVSEFEHIMKPQYFQVCYGFRDTLTYLCLGRLKQTYTDGGKNYGTHLELLPQFTSLTYLHIRSGADITTHRATGRYIPFEGWDNEDY